MELLPLSHEPLGCRGDICAADLFGGGLPLDGRWSWATGDLPSLHARALSFDLALDIPHALLPVLPFSQPSQGR